MALATASAPEPTVVAAVVVPDYRRIVADEAYWVSTAQLTCAGDGSGAIAEAAPLPAGARAVSVHPYEANIGARALLAGGDRYLPMVAAYLRWYLAHLNRPDRYGVAGTVYDWDYDPTTCVGTPQPHPVTGEVPKYDSTDAYAGTFLTLVAAYALADPSASGWLAEPAVRADLDTVADVIGATRGPSGLSAATPVHHAEYLLDNVEAARGLADYAGLLAAVGDGAGSARRAEEAAAMHRAIEDRLWSASTTDGMYGWAADQLSPSWATWFPDGFAQLWPLGDGLGPPSRRDELWRQYTRTWPDWAVSTPAYGTVSPDHDPNAATAYAAARVGDLAALDTYLDASERNWAGRPPPWTVDDSGFRALAAEVAGSR